MQRRRYAADDDIFRVHSRYLGPKGKTLPMSIPYRGILPGIAAFVLGLVVLSAFGVGLWRFVIAAALAAGAGKLADLYSSAERPVSSLPVIFSHETGAPRPRRQDTIQSVARPRLIPVRDPGTAPRQRRRRPGGRHPDTAPKQRRRRTRVRDAGTAPTKGRRR